jgi:hypothetical protein
MAKIYIKMAKRLLIGWVNWNKYNKEFAYNFMPEVRNGEKKDIVKLIKDREFNMECNGDKYNPILLGDKYIIEKSMFRPAKFPRAWVDEIVPILSAGITPSILFNCTDDILMATGLIIPAINFVNYLSINKYIIYEQIKVDK